MKGGTVMFAPKRILVPTDFSDDADAALKEALDLARQYHSRVYLLHVAEPVMECAVDYCLDPAAIKQAEDEEVNKSRILMQEEINKLGVSESVEIVTDIREGDTVSEILKEQDERDIDLIVMPSHRKKGILERMMGPVSEKIMEQATSPVLIVRH